MLKNQLMKLKNNSYKASMVLLLNLFVFFLFFARDILATRIFGLTTELDTIYFLLLIPTTLNYFLFFPLNESQTPKYQMLLSQKKELGAHFWKTNFYIVLTFSVIYLSFLGLIQSSLIKTISFFSPYWVSLSGDLLLSLPILLLGGLIISANIFLNSLGMIFFTTVSSLTVPVSSIIFILLGDKHFHEKSFLYGMLLGQALNFIFVYFAVCIKFGKHFFFWKTISPIVTPKSIFNYFSQGSSYFSLYGMTAMSASYAMGMHAGAVSMVLLVNKFVSFFSNLFQNVFNTVMYPYFSRLEMSDRERFKEEKLFYLVSLSFIGFLGIFCIAIFANPFAHMLFLSSKVKGEQIAVLSSMIKVGGIQLPMVMAMIIFFKWLNIKKDYLAMLALSALLLIIQYSFLSLLNKNLGFNIVFLATSLAFFGVGLLFAMRVKKLENFSIKDMLPFLIIWTLGIIPLFLWRIN